MTQPVTPNALALRARVDALRGKTGHVVLLPVALRDVPPGTVLYGRRETVDGETHHRVTSTTPADDLIPIATVSADPADDGTVRLELGQVPHLARIGDTTARVVVVDPSAYRDRIRALPGADALAATRVVVVGLGSVGSSIGASLARCGVEVIGCDPDRLDVSNLVRWGLAAGVKHVGRHKSAVWAEIVSGSVVDAKVTGHPLDVVRDAGRFDALIRDTRPHLLIVTTDTADSRRNVNAIAARHGVRTLYVALSDHASSARFEVVDDAAVGPCHLCSTASETALTGESTYGGRHSNTPYAGEDAEPEQVAVPALPANVSLANAYATRIALNVLAGRPWEPFFTRGEQRGNVMFLALEPGWWLFDAPLDRLTYAPERHPECPVCGDRSEA